MSFNPFHSLQELHIKYDHLWSFVHKILEILKEMEARHIVDKEMNERKILKKCKFFNRGFCREGKSCHYLHPEKNCREHCEGKSCSVNGDILIIVNTGRKETVTMVMNAYISTVTNRKTATENLMTMRIPVRKSVRKPVMRPQTDLCLPKK